MIRARVLKVTEIGDRWKKCTKPSIVLQGNWLKEAGILPNEHVEIENPKPGVLIIRQKQEA